MFVGEGLYHGCLRRLVLSVDEDLKESVFEVDNLSVDLDKQEIRFNIKSNQLMIFRETYTLSDTGNKLLHVDGLYNDSYLEGLNDKLRDLVRDFKIKGSGSGDRVVATLTTTHQELSKTKPTVTNGVVLKFS